MQNLDFSGFNIPMYAEPVVKSISKVSNNAIVQRDLSHFEDWNDKKVQDLTLEQLRMTSRENNDGAPNNGIRHYVLIQKVLDMCSERGLHGEVRDLFACKQGGGQYPGVSVVDNIAKSLPETPEMQQRNVQATIVRRIFCNITIKDFDLADGEYTNAITLSYSQRGIQAAVGPHVYACHNQCILNYDRMVSTFKDGSQNSKIEKIGYDQVLTKIAEWLDKMDAIAHTDGETINRMRKKIIPANMLFGLIGYLTAYRVQCDTKIKSIQIKETYPLNNFQINQFTERLLVKSKENSFANNGQGFVTAWDFYNAATDTIKPHQMDTVQIIPQHTALLKFMQDFQLA